MRLLLLMCIAAASLYYTLASKRSDSSVHEVAFSDAWMEKLSPSSAQAKNTHLPNLVQLHKRILNNKAADRDVKQQKFITAEFIKSGILSIPYSQYRLACKNNICEYVIVL